MVEALRGAGRTPLSVVLMADLPVPQALFIRFGVSATRDVDRGDTSVSLLVGTDLARWAVHLFGKPEPHDVEVAQSGGQR